MSPEKLTYMANQIARFFASQPEEKAVAGALDHIRHFWDPRMRSQILAHLAAGGEGLDPVARAAVAKLKEDKPA
ncbi:MAG TPA: formate dehydrogenase subunit delta [Acetobacteraceae bacterium]|nr:formate dehydrogenase subunit delta [Acetobacteraceae bacterium]